MYGNIISANISTASIKELSLEVGVEDKTILLPIGKELQEDFTPGSFKLPGVFFVDGQFAAIKLLRDLFAYPSRQQQLFLGIGTEKPTPAADTIKYQALI